METTELGLKEILAILKRQRRLFASTTAVVLGLALAYLVMATPIFTSSVLIQVDGRNANLLDPSSAPNEQSAVLNSRVDSEVEILRSDATALAVLGEANLIKDGEFGPQIGWFERLGIALGLDIDKDGLRRIFGLAPAEKATTETLVASSLKKLQSAVDIRRRGLTYLIAISVSSESPERAATIANTYARVYIDRQVATKTQSTISARDVLRRQIDTAQQELATSETAINTFIESNLARLEKETGDSAVASLRARLTQAKEAQVQSRARITSAESALAAGDWTSLASTLNDEAVQELVRQRESLRARLGDTEATSAEAVDLQSEIAALDADLTARSNEALGLLRNESTAFGEQESAARDDLRNLLLTSDLSADLLADLYNLQQRATVARNQYQTLLAREQDFGAMANLQIADARIVSEALPPNGPSAPNKQLIIALALVGGIGLGTALAFLKEFYIGGIVSANQLSNVLQAPVPVTFTLLEEARGGQDPADLVTAAPMSLYSETFRKLRAAIDVGLSQSPAKVGTDSARGKIVLVCSALQAEGKSTTAIALARTYSMAGIPTILIDADMRRPSVGPRLGIIDNPGLISFVSAESKKPREAIEPAQDPLSSVVVIPAGPRSSVPTDQLLISKNFQAVIDLAAKSFDIVILDSPPMLPVVDTRYLARHADAVIHVVRYATTSQGEVREAAQQLREHMRPDVHYIGVLNLEETAASSYGYYGRYGYYGDDDR